MSKLLLPVVELLLLPTGVLTHLCVPRGEGLGDGDGVMDGSKARTTTTTTSWTARLLVILRPMSEGRVDGLADGSASLSISRSPMLVRCFYRREEEWSRRRREARRKDGVAATRMGRRPPVGCVTGARIGGGSAKPSCSWRTREGERPLRHCPI